jgi:hypothetical protein
MEATMLKTTWALKLAPSSHTIIILFFQRVDLLLTRHDLYKKIPKLLSCSMLEDGGNESDDEEAEIAN